MPQQPDFIPDAQQPDFIPDDQLKFGQATSIRGVSPKEHYTRLIGEELPLVLGMMGGTAGLAAGGPFAPATAVAGAALGGGVGTAGKHLLYDVADIPQPPTTRGQAVGEMAREMTGQAGQEAASQIPGSPLVSKAARDFLERGAVKSLTSALRPTGRGVDVAKKVVPEVLEKRALRPTQAYTRDKLERTIEANIKRAGQAVEAATRREVPAGATVDTKPVIQALEQYKQSFMVPKQVGQTGMQGGFTLGPADKVARKAEDVITAVQNDLKGMGPKPSYESVLKVRQHMDKWLGVEGHFAKEDEIADEIENDAVDAIRHELYKPYPNVQRANAEFSMWRNVKRAFSPTSQEMSRYEHERLLRYGMEVGGGALAAPYSGAAGLNLTAGQGAELGAAAVMVEAAVRSTAWKVASANTKDALAKAIWNGDMGQILRISTRVMQGGARAADVPPIEEPPPMPQRATVTVEESHR